MFVPCPVLLPSPTLCPRCLAPQGILALFCCGVVVSQWALPAMSRGGAEATTTAYATLSHLSEGIIFLYVGMDALDQVG